MCVQPCRLMRLCVCVSVYVYHLTHYTTARRPRQPRPRRTGAHGDVGRSYFSSVTVLHRCSAGDQVNRLEEVEKGLKQTW